MECGKLTAKLQGRGAGLLHSENGKEVKRYKNIEIPGRDQEAAL